MIRILAEKIQIVNGIWRYFQRLFRGQTAEKIAADFLSARGLTIICRNYRCRMGELDIVAKDGETLIFVEVRCRADNRYGHALDSIDRAKKKRLISAAACFLTQYESCPCRFDVITMDRLSMDTVNWMMDAFDVPSE